MFLIIILKNLAKFIVHCSQYTLSVYFSSVYVSRYTFFVCVVPDCSFFASLVYEVVHIPCGFTYANLTLGFSACVSTLTPLSSGKCSTYHCCQRDFSCVGLNFSFIGTWKDLMFPEGKKRKQHPPLLPKRLWQYIPDFLLSGFPKRSLCSLLVHSGVVVHFKAQEFPMTPPHPHHSEIIQSDSELTGTVDQSYFCCLPPLTANATAR